MLFLLGGQDVGMASWRFGVRTFVRSAFFVRIKYF